MNQKKYLLDSVAPRIEKFLETLIRDGRFQLSIQICEGETRHPDFENPDVVVRFSGQDVDLLLANKAELLLAFEQLTMEMLRIPADDHSRLCFDANDYRMLRIEELRLSAMTAADKVKRSGVPFTFNPMSSRERRIIHLALRDEPAVRSESSGMAPHRQVVIYPANMAARPPAPPPVVHRGRRR